MELTTLTISLPKNIGVILEKKAKANGQGVQDFVADLVKTQALRPSLDEILAPVRQDFAESGMTEDEWDILIDNERQLLWEEKHGKKV